MTSYVSKPQKIKAFQFDRPDFEKPDWFVEAMEHSKAFIVLYPKDDPYIIIKSKRGNPKAFKGDWICINEYGRIFTVPCQEFVDDYKKE